MLGYSLLGRGLLLQSSRPHAVHKHTRHDGSRRVNKSHLSSLGKLLLVPAILLGEILRRLETVSFVFHALGTFCHIIQTESTNPQTANLRQRRRGLAVRCGGRVRLNIKPTDDATVLIKLVHRIGLLPLEVAVCNIQTGLVLRLELAADVGLRLHPLEVALLSTLADIEQGLACLSELGSASQPKACGLDLGLLVALRRRQLRGVLLLLDREVGLQVLLSDVVAHLLVSQRSLHRLLGVHTHRLVLCGLVLDGLLLLIAEVGERHLQPGLHTEALGLVQRLDVGLLPLHARGAVPLKLALGVVVG